MSNDVQNHRNTTELAIIAAIVILLISSYIYGYPAFKMFGFTSSWIDKGIHKMLSINPVFGKTDLIFKVIAIYFSFLFALGSSGKKEMKLEKKGIYTIYAFAGGLIFLASFSLFRMPGIILSSSVLYVLVTLVSFTFFNIGINRLYQLYRYRKMLGKLDKFNDIEEEFDQVETKIGDEDSIYIPACYGPKKRRSYWNFVLPFAGNIVTGNPGTGKSFVFINEFIRQSMLKGWTMCVYDFKRGELSDLVYRYLIKNKRKILAHPNFKDVKPTFNVFDIDDPSRSVRINPLSADLLQDEADCNDMATLFLESLNRSWIEKKGEFFSESSKALLGALIIFLRYTSLKSKEENGELAKLGNCCSLPHVISLLNYERDDLFSVLANHPATQIAFSAFVDAVNDGAGEQLSGQVATTKISLARFATAKVYWALSGNDCSTFVSDPKNPQYLCLVNNEQRRETYGAVISMIMGQVVKKVNRPGNKPTLLAIDELATVYVKDIDILIATARSNKVAVLLGFQDMAQLVKDYGKKVADTVRNTVGNMVSGRVMAETAKDMQEMFGKVLQRRHSNSISNSGVSFSESTQMDYVIPASKISGLSQGEFVLRLSDTRKNPLPVRYAKGHADMDMLGDERLEHPSNNQYHNLNRPEYKKSDFLNAKGEDITDDILAKNFAKIKKDVKELIQQEMEALGIISA
ncbi:YWFCY domain-containing protein [Pedobacter jeongneungensis]|uniref:YWFCY domain-containing protein n=1 Tax=Pedobacter jeongneungensis TaxID=947309 RepID=UPI0009FDAB29|nr:TraM recognition domain-containing protein [Pedobacter jeongneungensis]